MMYTVHTLSKSKNVRSRADLYNQLQEHKAGLDAGGVLETLSDLPFEKKYVVVQKSGSEPTREFIIHFRPGCPNTARALGAIDRAPDTFRVHMLSANDTRTNTKLQKYLKKHHPEEAITYPRVFSQFGELIGGATELIEHLS